MSERDTSALEVAASTILRAAAPGKIKLPCAMRLAGFTDDESRIVKLQMRVRRLLRKSTIPVNVELKYGCGTVSTIGKSGDDEQPPNDPKEPETPKMALSAPSNDPKEPETTKMALSAPSKCRKRSHLSFSKHEKVEKSSSKQRLEQLTSQLATPKSQISHPQISFAAMSLSKKPPPEIENSKQRLEQLEGTVAAPKKTRRTCNQKRVYDARMIMRKEKDIKGHKLATALVSENREKAMHERQSDAAIVWEINRQHGCNLSVHTVQRSVRKGLIGDSPLRRGPFSLQRHLEITRNKLRR
jgi:hypothetical protein